MSSDLIFRDEEKFGLCAGAKKRCAVGVTGNGRRPEAPNVDNDQIAYSKVVIFRDPRSPQ